MRQHLPAVERDILSIQRWQTKEGFEPAVRVSRDLSAHAFGMAACLQFAQGLAIEKCSNIIVFLNEEKAFCRHCNTVR